MARLSLKNIIGKDGIDSILSSLVELSGASLCIKDVTGKILLGNENDEDKFEYPVKADDQQIGLVKGDEKAIVVANNEAQV